MNTLILKRQSLKARTIAVILGVVASVILPQLFHGVGIVSGLGASLGAAFLPMHLPVIFIGLLYGAIPGFLCGALSPIISFAISGMPIASLLPFMIIELSVYGLVSGMLSRVKMSAVLKVLSAQLAGRAVRSIAVIASFYILNNHAIALSSIYTTVTAGLPGIILQLCILPLLIFRLENIHE